MEKPLLTVLMPVYNAEKFLKESIDSILSQTFTAFEFLIIDDASTDSSASIIQSYTDSRIRYVRNNENLGISATLNRGIIMCNTELIARMDADDISHPQRLAKQYAFFQQHPDCALLSCWTNVITEDKQLIRTEKYKSRYYYYNLTFECWIYHPTIVFKKSAVMDVGMYSTPYAEDYELFWQMLRKYKIYNLPEVLLDYRVTAYSLHQVTKKKEYEAAQAAQVARNISFYAGDVQLTPEQFECLRHNFLLMSIREIVDCLRKLQFITQKIIATKNINNDPVAIKEAAYFKKQFILSHYVRSLPWYKALYLRILVKLFS